MKCFTLILLFPLIGFAADAPSAASLNPDSAAHRLYQTTRSGDRLKAVPATPLSPESKADIALSLDPSRTYQTLLGIGGSFTESAAEVCFELSEEKRAEVLRACFSPEGAHYSMTRTPIASCDFSLRPFTYAPVAGDRGLESFSIAKDHVWLLPLIEAAMKVEGADFRILASPWTAPPWMKDNGTWNGGKLLPEFYGVFSEYLVRYVSAYEDLGIPIWGITPINEPHGNGSNWESTHFSPEEMKGLIRDYLGPAVRKSHPETLIWIYDQNRGKGLRDWADTILSDPETAQYVAGTAVHWYESTVSSQEDSLDYVHRKYPGKQLLHSEGCIDAMGDDEPIGVWLEDDWYWRPEATDWGYLWASEDNKHRHPPYRPFYRYARDLITGLNHHLTAWIDWNLMLNTRGGPNHARNYCLAPILVDSGRDSVYYTPLYYAMAHVSKFIRPGAVRLHLSGTTDGLLATAFRNPDQSVAVVIFNREENEAACSLTMPGERKPLSWMVPAQGMQTLVFTPPDRL